MARPSGVTKWAPPNLPRWYEDIPKATLFVIARQLGALAAGTADDLGSGEAAIMREWEAQYRAGLVPQKPTSLKGGSRP